ncbi:hypothetical protein Nepgr_018768 [Nepenthes gracilis]|uniref:Uncharacterized protein n=1 Tax=Nepenthes gracilis TaxID=150966 RepID=A0AAD3STP0_NEPGR|nr:hypothetical protein Nepgr_018768 [Nepenthes gracilis]
MDALGCVFSYGKFLESWAWWMPSPLAENQFGWKLLLSAEALVEFWTSLCSASLGMAVLLQVGVLESLYFSIWNVLHAFVCLRIHSRLSLLGEDCSWKLDAATSGWLIFGALYLAMLSTGEGQFAEMVGCWVALVGLGMLMSLLYVAVGLFVCCDVVDVIPLTLRFSVELLSLPPRFESGLA